MPENIGVGKAQRPSGVRQRLIKGLKSPPGGAVHQRERHHNGGEDRAPPGHEPVIPAEAAQTICVVGASGFGKPIREAAHRPELYARLAGAAETDLVTPGLAAAVLTAEKLHSRVLVNQAELAVSEAKELAGLLDCPAVAGSLKLGKIF